MPRHTIDELAGYAMDVQVGEEPVIDNGMPVYHGTGEPKMKPTWRFVYRGRGMDGGMHTVLSPPFDEEAKAKLIAALTGVTPIGAIDLPPGVTL